MPHTHAIGIGVRHAISRALATANMAISDATFRIIDSRVTLGPRHRVVRGEATLEILSASALSGTEPGVVNPDGEHPLMVWIPGEPGFFMDMFPVTWDRWLRHIDDRLPPDLDPLCPRIGTTVEAASAFALRLGKRLPSAAEFARAWGAGPYPWGESNDPRSGRAGRPRYGELPEVGMHPPADAVLFDLGAWLWQWLDDGQIAGVQSTPTGPSIRPPTPDDDQIGIRLVQDP